MKHKLILAAVLTVSAARAEEARSVAKSEASRHFQDAVKSVARGDLVAAVGEFEAAYASSPHFSVLYNIGQARWNLGQPVEAAEAFERYLGEGGEQLSASRRHEVEGLLAEIRARIGRVRIVVEAPNTTRVWLDGKLLRGEHLAQPFSLAAGLHSLLQAQGSGAVLERQVSVQAGELREIRLPAGTPGDARLTQLAISCDVPGVRVEVEDSPPIVTPLVAPLLVKVGKLTVRFSRPGYSTVTKGVTTALSRLARLSCDVTPILPVPAPLAAVLDVRVEPRDARVLVDNAVSTRAPLPAGPHDLSIQRDGFAPVRRSLVLQAGKAMVLVERLAPTETTLARAREAATRSKTAGVLTAGGGAAILTAGISLLVWNSGRYDDWRVSRGQGDANTELNRAIAIQRVDDVATGVMILGAGLVFAGAGLFLTAE